MYRMQQVGHVMAMIPAGPLLPCVIPTAEGIIIAGISAGILYHGSLHPFVLGAAASTSTFAILALMMCLKLANITIQNSKEYKKLYKHGTTVKSHLDRIHFQSYRPLEWVIGNSFKIEKDTFPIIMQNVVIETVVNFLVYSRS